uniref:Ig-like domain-containing protein n=1 Tax=Echeneis naucrates TaxID=173247 RepID=A0A665VIJ9_ECHNA
MFYLNSPPFFQFMNNFILAKVVDQDSGLISANVGDNLTLKCFHGDDVPIYFWYKQAPGQKLKPISSSSRYENSGKFFDEFRNNPRFSLEKGPGFNHLKVSDLKLSDSATYNCASGYSFQFEFMAAITVSVRGSGFTVQVHQSGSQTVQPGDSVTLNCTVQIGNCEGEHSVHWFKDSGKSHPGLIYTHGGRNDQCERDPESQTHSCVYNLPMKSLNISHAGTYYCAVTSCGRILFGNGTELDIKDEMDCYVLVCFLSGALVLITIVSVLLAFKLHSKNSFCYQVGRDADNLNYAALRFNPSKRSQRHQDNKDEECVYSSVQR